MSQSASDSSEQSEHVIALHAEQAAFLRVQVAGCTTRVETITRAHNQEIDEMLFRETVDVRHVPMGREVDVAPEIVRDGDLTIIPIVEEIIVVTRKLVLKEEIHLRRVRSAVRYQETVTLRTQEAVITRASPAETLPETPPTSTPNQS